MVVRAYAKINLTLDILGKREDGYHLIDSVFQSVGIFDTLRVEKENGLNVLCGGVNEQKNTAFIAAKEFFKTTGITPSARIEIDKNIPFLSGLGGGSADAVAVIIALDKIYKTNLKKQELSRIALGCGADVPFFLKGGTVRVGGIGEKTGPLPYLEGFWAVIVKHGEKKSTMDMYGQFDKSGVSTAFTEKFIKCAENFDYKGAFGNMGNAFSAVASDNRLLSELRSENPYGVSLSGSGPSHFAVFADGESALAAAEKLSGKGYSPYAVPFTSRAYEIIE